LARILAHCSVKRCLTYRNRCSGSDDPADAPGCLIPYFDLERAGGVL